MGIEFGKKLDNYAELAVCHGLNVQKGQIVNLAGEAVHRELLFRLAEHSYKRGAAYVSIDLIEPRLAPLRAAASSLEGMDFVPSHVPARYAEILEKNGANLRVVGPEDPLLMEGVDPGKVNRARVAVHKSIRQFYEDGIGCSKVHWCVLAAPTIRWAERVFPELKGEAAMNALWEDLFKICRVGDGDHLAQWKRHNTILCERAKRLTDLGMKTLHFTGPGTDLRVGLSERAVFKGGSELGPHGVEFEPNIPTEECFTTPDWRKTEGVVRATRPFLVNGKLIQGLSATFEKGELVEFSAESGSETFAAYINSDPGGRRLGEVALVGIDSPIFRSGRVYEEILLDENAACHIAVGSAYKFCLREGPTLSKDVLDQLGCNESSVHTDMMISSEQVSVRAELYNGNQVDLIANGAWKEF